MVEENNMVKEDEVNENEKDEEDEVRDVVNEENENEENDYGFYTRSYVYPHYSVYVPLGTDLKNR